MDGKRALVTGVGPGTGRSIVQRLVSGGYEVAMIARSGDRLQGFAAEMSGAQAYPADVADTAQFADILDKIYENFGAPELVIHNAVGGVLVFLPRLSL